MRFLDDFNTEQKDHQIHLDLSLSDTDLHKTLFNDCVERQPEVLVAHGIEADHVLRLLAPLSIHCGAIALQHPTFKHVNIEQLNSQYGVIIQLDPEHSHYESLNQRFTIIPPAEDFEQAVQFLKNTYMLSPIDPKDFID